jgi:hypothetical protein
MAAVCELKDCTVVVAKVAAWKSLQCGSMSLLNIFIAGLSPVSLIYDNEIEMRADAAKLRDEIEGSEVLL